MLIDNVIHDSICNIITAIPVPLDIDVPEPMGKQVKPGNGDATTTDRRGDG